MRPKLFVSRLALSSSFAWLLPAVVLASLGLTSPAAAQTTTDENSSLPFVPRDPKDLGLAIPDGPVVPGRDRRVLTMDDDRKEVVAKLHVQAGSHSIVMLPSGQLRSVPTTQTKETVRPFVPLTQDELLNELKAKQFKGFKTYKTRNYIFLYDSSEIFAQGTRAILESMYPGLVRYLKTCKIDVQDPEVPMAVIMFKTEADFQKFREMPEGVVAYYDGITNYVVMYEQSQLAEVAPNLAMKQAIATVAHEGVHQVLHNVGVQQRLSRWPMWISEGLPEYFSATEVKRGRWKGVGQPNDMRMYELSNFYKERRGHDPDGGTVKDTVNADSLTSTGYAAAWALTHYLAESRKQQFYTYLREMSQIGPLEGDGRRGLLGSASADNLTTFNKHFGGEIGGIEESMVKHMQSLPYADPIENQTHYVAKLYTDLGGSYTVRTMITMSPASITRWRQDLLSSVPAQLRARSRFVVNAFPTRSAAVIGAAAP